MTLMQTPSTSNGEIARTEQQPTTITVEDSSQFANFLDTGKFNQLWRVARLFAATAIIPQHFQGKPEDCFIACQMAMRLGIDPMMFMQNTHVVHGKPGMQGKLAIALINSSGLYAGPLQFKFDGEGDDYGCTAWAINKETGERIEGPKVTLKMVKAEGWNKNPKWQSMPDLMFRYRAGSYFGNTLCPQRLMGMATIEELEDMTGSPVQVESRVVDKLALTDRLTPAQADAPKPEDFDREPAATEAKAAATTNEQDPALEDWDRWYAKAGELAESLGSTPAEHAAAIKKSLVKAGKVGREQETDQAWRDGVMAAIRDKAGNWAYLNTKGGSK